HHPDADAAHCAGAGSDGSGSAAVPRRTGFARAAHGTAAADRSAAQSRAAAPGDPGSADPGRADARDSYAADRRDANRAAPDESNTESRDAVDTLLPGPKGPGLHPLYLGAEGRQSFDELAIAALDRLERRQPAHAVGCERRGDERHPRAQIAAVERAAAQFS